MIDRSPPLTKIGLAALGALGVAGLAALVLAGPPDVAAMLADATRALGAGTYGLVAVMVILGTVVGFGLLAPDDTALLVAGAAAAHGHVRLLPLIAMAWVAGVLGDVAGFLLGRRRGRALLLGGGARLGVDSASLARLKRLLGWRGLALIAGRFAGPVRAFAPFLAGASGYPLRRLMAPSVIGAGVWCATFALAGYGFAHSLQDHLDLATNILLGVAGAATLAWVVRRRGGARAAA